MKKCKNCGNEMEDSQLFCAKCGTKNDLANEKVNIVNSERETRHSQTSFWRLLGIILFFVFFGIGIYMGSEYKVIETTAYGRDTSTFNYLLMGSCWSIGIAFNFICQIIYSVCYRLDLLIDKK